LVAIRCRITFVREENQFLKNGGRNQNAARLEPTPHDIQRIKGVLLVVSKVERDVRIPR
jgi:hypothetical protein